MPREYERFPNIEYALTAKCRKESSLTALQEATFATRIGIAGVDDAGFITIGRRKWY
jgi:hypothetical protein